MGRNDDDPAGKTPRQPIGGDEAFALTMTPDPSQRTAAAKPRSSAPAAADISAEQTVAAPVTGQLPPLPEIATGVYRADREIARGGMGRIVAAEDCRLGRPVALKELIEPGGEQNARFQREALITARLQHPGIVPVYEAGRWPTGEPFFAMKLVSGKPLDQVIAHATKLEDRLALLPRLAAACDAIAYAHSQRIVHRDLKPSNILLGDFGETVVIDWGLAKDIDSVEAPVSQTRGPRAYVERPSHHKVDSASSTLTVAGAVMGTPAYMPPEQARGEPVDQRADVFALGALLYHLLAGVPPYNARTATEVLASAASGRFVPLPKREKRAPRELVAIVERAMAAEPAARYPNAGGLAEELRRFLTGQLVDAHRYTAVQRVARFVRRHRAAVTIATIAIAGFAIGGSIAIRNVVRARDEARAEERIASTRKVAAEHLIDYTLTHVKTQLTAIGRLDLLAGLGAEVKLYYDKLSKIPGGMPADDETRMVEAIDLIGQAEHTSGKPDLALATWRDARDKITRIVAVDPGPRTFPMRKMLAQLDVEAGEIYQERGLVDQAIQQYRTAIQEWNALENEQPKHRELWLAAAETHDRVGDLLRNEGKIDAAFGEYGAAKTERELIASLGNARVSEEVLALSTSHLKLGSVYQVRGESSLALDQYRESLRLREQERASEPDNVIIAEKVLESEEALGELERSVGDDAAAIETYERALPVTVALGQRDPSNASWRRQRGNILADMGFAQIDAGHFKDGLARLGEAIDLQRDLSARDPKSTRYRVDLSRSYTREGDAHLYLGQTAEAIARYERAKEIRAELVDKDQASVPFRRSLAWSFAKLGAAYGASNDAAHAIEAHEKALAIRSDLVAGAPAQGGYRNELASTEIELGRLLAPHEAKRGEDLVAGGLARARALVDNDPINNEWKETLVRGLLARAATGDAKTAAAALVEAEQIAAAGYERAPQNVQISVLFGEVEVELAAHAEARGDSKAASVAWQAAASVLESLAKDGRLPATKAAILARARARR
jgi:serine/threonine protein kinase